MADARPTAQIIPALLAPRNDSLAGVPERRGECGQSPRNDDTRPRGRVSHLWFLPVPAGLGGLLELGVDDALVGRRLGSLLLLVGVHVSIAATHVAIRRCRALVQSLSQLVGHRLQ